MADSYSTKKALAQALKECMREESFCKISVSKLCEKCRMNRKSFYYHFRDKYDLLNWIFDNEFNDILKEQEDLWKVTLQLCHHLEENRDFFKKAMKVEGQNCFCTYFKDRLTGFYDEKISSLYFPTDKFKARFYTDSIVLSLARWMCRSDYNADDLVNKLKECMTQLNS